MRFIMSITQFQVTTAMNYGVLTQCMNVNYVVSHDEEAFFCFNVLSVFYEY
jgi:hypothetical protein